MREHLFWVANIVLCCTVREVISASSYTGGTVTLVPTSGDEYRVIRRTTWSGSVCTQCSNCTDIWDTLYYLHTCTGNGGTTNSSYSYSSPSDWRHGYGIGNLIARVYSPIRRDNGQKNNPPVVNSVPIFYLNIQCGNMEMELPVYDLDGDVIRCRFATGAECGEACYESGGLTLDTDTCTLRYTPTTAYYDNPITIQVEDFYDETSTSPLSTIPLQFYLYTYTYSVCYDKAEIVTPTHNSEYTLIVGREFVLNITTRDRDRVIAIETARPVGMVISEEITWLAASYSYISINATWTPSPDDERAHVFCFTPSSSLWMYSNRIQACVVLLVTSDISDCVSLTHPTDGTVSAPNTQYGGIATYTCNNGYVITGTTSVVTTSVTCLAGGTWSESAPTCSKRNCGGLDNPTSGAVSTPDTEYEGVATYTCTTGYVITGTSGNTITRTCEASGSWSESDPTCTKRDCGDLGNPTNGAVSTSNTEYEGVAIYTCNTGYVITGTSSNTITRTCEDSGSWSGSDPTCAKRDCESNPSNAVTAGTATLTSGTTTYRSTANVNCIAGYETPTAQITCQADGQWSTSVCTITNCGSNPSSAVTDGTATPSSGTTFQSTATVKCNTGYDTPTKQITCQASGQWSTSVCTIKIVYGGECHESHDCLTNGAVCRNQMCLCKTGIVNLASNICDIMPLSEFGMNDDIVLPMDDACSSAVTFLPGFTIFGRTFKSVYICSNGYISLDKKFSDPKPPNRSLAFPDFAIIAPYYAETNDSSREVYYRYYDITNDNGKRLKMDDVKNIEAFIHLFGNDNFQTAFILIVTWKDVRPFDAKSQGTATFQLVLVTDGTDTFVLFIYEHDGMKWSLQKPNIWIGYHATTKHTKTSLLSSTRQALTADKHAFTKGVRGVTLHHLNSQNETPPVPVVNGIKCFRWYNDNVGQSQGSSGNLPDCPCDLTKLSLDSRFSTLENVPGNSDIACTTVVPSPRFSPHGKSCCYNTTTHRWVQEKPHAGSFFMFHPIIRSEHILHDLNAKMYCCDWSPYCDKYYELRPIGNCYRKPWSRPANAWGDPHFRTFDGNDFTFNGWGEYIMTEVWKDGTLFQLQARTSRPLIADGSRPHATVFRAFAAKGGDDAHVHVELDQSKTGYTVYANGLDISLAIRQANYTHETNNTAINIVKLGGTISVFFPFFDIALNITVNVGMLKLDMLMNEEFQNQTTGLLGNFNGNPDDDFILPNGTKQNSNMSEREIFEYARQWNGSTNASLFIYHKGKGHKDHHNGTYVPNFLDEAPSTLIEEAVLFCSGEQNKECIFDYVQTENEEVATQTKSDEGNARDVKQEIESKIPKIDGCTLGIINIHDDVVCQLRTEDADDTIIVEGLDNYELYDNKTLVFKINSDTPVRVSVQAENADNKTSPNEPIGILLCTGCSGNGMCSTTETRDVERYFDGFAVAKCICQIGYDGDDCENDFDGCAARPCSLFRDCEDMTPDDHVQSNKAYRCGPCPDGYELTSNGRCIDIDECKEDNDICEHTCTDTEGGFICSCMAGYRIDTLESSNCTDINECDEALHQCEHLCINIDGYYTCACYEGFDLTIGDRQTCEQHDTDVCSDSDIDCSDADGCTVESGKSKCFCNNGYNLTRDNTCEDIDECIGNVCPQKCSNTEGGFTCGCFIGYNLSDKTTCTACAFPTWGDNCGNICDCPDAIRCDPVKGCICQPGLTGIQCDNDIDECDTDVNLCQDVRKTCDNTVGSYVCACIDGYEIGQYQQCKDIDECSSPLLNDCEQTCNNVVGSYTCNCRQGYEEADTTHCKDVDECGLQTAKCDHICENHEGGFNCYCEFGYILLEDRRTCEEDENPCKSANLTCEVCITNLITQTYSCGCKAGFKLGVDGTSCLDIQECEDPDLNKCQGNVVCINERGSYRCECPKGYKLQRDRRTCSECDGYHYGTNCEEVCNCLRGSCDNRRGCICDEGWLGVECDQDKDECHSTQNLCIGDQLECLNTPGSYKCQCKTGFHRINGTCEDIDECSKIDGNSCAQICSNTVGSFRCLCQPGFIQQDDECIDIDECVTRNECEQKCDNTVGSYRCSCTAGYYLDLLTRKSCAPMFECNSTQEDTCTFKNADCIMLNGKPECNCWKGYVGYDTVDKCEDIDECSGTPCDQICDNTDGGYTCTCREGFWLDVDQVTCKVCNEGYFGNNCGETCACLSDNTLSCDVIDGSCTCRPGWTGGTCNSDVDECTDASIYQCPDNTDCINTDGSFTCKCHRGYQKTSMGVCEVCQQFKYGDECTSMCSCNVTHTLTCNPTDGRCSCKEGWESQDCSDDIDECASDTDICVDVVNSVCRNYPGTYACTCNGGFYEQDGLCLDIDECQEHVDACSVNCENTEGGFVCKCFDGYSGDGITCTACTGNTYGNNCSLACPCVADHSVTSQQSCDKVTGACFCKGVWTGQNCEVDINECENEELCKEVEFADCHNEEGGFVCGCYSGYVKDGNGQCVKVSPPRTTTIGPKYKQNAFQVILSMTVPLGTNMHVDKTYNYYATWTLNALTLFYTQTTGIELFAFFVIIDDVRPGSLGVVVKFTLFYLNEGEFEKKLRSATVMLADETILTFYNKGISSKLAVQSNPADRCAVYQELFGDCEVGYTCEVIIDEVSCSLDTVDHQLILIIGISAGGIVLVLLLVLLILCIRVRRYTNNNKKAQKRADPGVESNEVGVNNPAMSEHQYTDRSHERVKRPKTWRTLARNYKQNDGQSQLPRPKIRTGGNDNQL